MGGSRLVRWPGTAGKNLQRREALQSCLKSLKAFTCSHVGINCLQNDPSFQLRPEDSSRGGAGADQLATL